MVGVLKDMTNSEEYKNVLSIDCVNGKNETPLQVALEANNYQIVKILFDPSLHTYTAANINKMIKICLGTKEEFDVNNEALCLNFRFFQSLLTQKGIDGFAALSNCLKSKRVEYFEYLYDVNDQLQKPFTCEYVWHCLGQRPNYKIMKLMINTNKKGFEYKSLGNSDRYWEAMQQVCKYRANDSDSKDCDYLKCFQLLLEQKEIQSVLKNGKATLALLQLINTNKDDCIECLFETSRKLGWQIDFTKPHDELCLNPLLVAVSKSLYSICKRLVNTGWFDINYKGYYNQESAILVCAQTMHGYDKLNSKDCPNRMVFDLLLNEKGIDLNVKDRNGCDVLALCQMRHKYSFIDCLHERLNDSYCQWTFDKTEFDNQLIKHSIIDTIINVCEKSDYKALKSILASRRAQNVIEDVINLVGLQRRTNTMTTALNACIDTNAGYDHENVLNCNNFKCFKLILSQKGIDPNIKVNAYNGVQKCLLNKKIEFFKYLIETGAKKKWCIDINPRMNIYGRNVGNNKKNIHREKKNKNTRDSVSRMYSYSSDDNILKWAATNGNFKIFELLLKISKIKYDINEVLIACAGSKRGYDEHNVSTCDNFLIFDLILKQDGINLNYQKKKYPIETVLINLVISRKYEFITHMFNDKKLNIDRNTIDLSKHIRNRQNDNLLFLAANESDYKMIELLLDLFSWNINEIAGVAQETLLLRVAMSHSGYNIESALIGNNFKTFELLLKQQNINLTIENKYGYDVINCLLIVEKYKFLDYLIKKFNLDVKMINKLKKRYSIANKLIKAAYNSDYNQLKSILECQTEYTSNYINLIGKYYSNTNSGNYGTAINACAFTMLGFDKSNEKQCANFRCFELLLKQRDINPSIGTWHHDYYTNCGTTVVTFTGYSTLIYCVWREKLQFIKYLIDNCNIIGKNERDYLNQNAMMLDVAFKPNKYLKILLDSNIFDINHVSDYGSILQHCSRVTWWYQGYNPRKPLHCPIFDCIKLLLSNEDINSNIKDFDGYTPLMSFIVNDKYLYFKYLIELNENRPMGCKWQLGDITKDINDRNENLLYVAAKYGRFKCLKLLLSLKIFTNINYIGGKNNDTILNACINSKNYQTYNVSTYQECDNYKCFKLILSQKGIDPSIKNKFGYDSFDLCYRADKREYLKELKEWKKKSRSLF